MIFKLYLINKFKYSLAGLKSTFQSEVSFKIEVVAFVVLSIVISVLPNMQIMDKLILFTSLFIPLFAELINTAIESCVNLITQEYDELAKKAKDIASAAVLISFIMTFCIWLTVFIKVYLGGDI